MSQIGDDDNENQVAFYSQKLLPHETKYSIIAEMSSHLPGSSDLASVHVGATFTVQTDHGSLDSFVG